MMNNQFGFPKAQHMSKSLLTKHLRHELLNKTFNHDTMFHIHKIIELLVAVHGLHTGSPRHTMSNNKS